MVKRVSVSAVHDMLSAANLKTFIFSTDALAANAWPAFDHGKIIFNDQRAPDQESGVGDLVASYPADNFGRLTVTTGARAARVTADYSSEGTGNHPATPYWFRNNGVPNQDLRFNPTEHIDGMFGQGSIQTPAITIVPPNTTVTLVVRGEGSSNNQRMVIGSSLTVQEI